MALHLVSFLMVVWPFLLFLKSGQCFYLLAKRFDENLNRLMFLTKVERSMPEVDG